MKVLLVDDSGLSRKVQAKVLNEVGVDNVVEAKNGLEALRKLEELDFRVDLLMTDWNMPGMNGIALIEAVRKAPAGRNLPIIVVSSENEQAHIQQVFTVGANTYVTKPFKKELLARKIESCTQVAGLGAREDQGKRPPGAGAAPSGGAGGGGDAPLIEGDLEKMGFAELVQFFNYTKKTGELVIALEAADAGLSFVNGEVKDAWIGRFASEQAFFSIARLRQGRFKFHAGRPPRQTRIAQGTLSLLMEAMRQLDEEEKARGA